jgi:arylsulfatase A-like enzyme
VGLLEGVILYGLQAAGWATWTMIRDGVDARILIVSPLFDLALFLCFGLLWAAVALLLRGRDVLPWAVGFYALAGFYALLACSGRLNDLACTLLALGLATQTALRLHRNPEGSLRFLRRSLPVLVGLLVAVAGSTGRFWFGPFESPNRLPITKIAGPTPEEPNVLLVVLDTVRADHLGAYGYSRATSPNFDRFAREGVLFENAYAASSWTLPSHASLFTNLYPFENHVDPWFLDPQFLTLAESLGSQRFATGAAVGNTYWCNYATGIAQGFQHNADYFHNLADSIHRTLFGRKAIEGLLRLAAYYRNPAKKTADRVNHEILAWLDSRPGPPRPFFAFLNYYDAHEPCFPPPPYDGRFAPADQVNGRQPLDTHQALPQPVPAERLQADLDAYDATIAHVDSQLGALWAELQRRGLTQNTLLIITSDHGHSWGEGGVYGHRTSLRREQIHVPLVFYWPGHISAGVRVSTPVSNIHVPATVTDLLGMGPDFPGRSLAALWRNPAAAAAWNEPVLAELARPRRDLPAEWPITRGDMKTLVTDRWQYLEWPDGSAQLFDLQADPRLEHDLAATPEGRAVAVAFHAQLEQILSSRRHSPPARTAPFAGPE